MKGLTAVIPVNVHTLQIDNVLRHGHALHYRGTFKGWQEEGECKAYLRLRTLS